MANPEHLKAIKLGVDAWNQWRLENFAITPDLSGADLSHLKLHYAQLHAANLERVNFWKTELIGADLQGANLNGADLRKAELQATNLSFSTLTGANMGGAKMATTILGANDLSRVRGLEDVRHSALSIVGIETVYRSNGAIPETFLRGCGVPDHFITYARSFTTQPIEFYSCFISYSHKDEDFARRLFSKMRDAKLRAWFAPEEMKGGRKLHEQIFSAIQLHDKLLLVLSENSLQSEWVATEIRRARKTEREENRRKLFPIRLVDFDAIQKWECFDAESGKDLGVELREYFIPDFSNWKDHDAFEKAFDRLLRDLKAKEKKA